MKIQLNSKEAILEIIEKDPEFQIEIKKAIINYISSKYVKGICNSEIAKVSQQATLNILRDTKLNDFYSGNDYYFTPKPKTLKYIQEKVDERFRSDIEQLVIERLKPAMDKINKIIDDKVNLILNKVEDSVIDKLVKERVNKLMNSLK